jgi:hypothetical protein
MGVQAQTVQDDTFYFTDTENAAYNIGKSDANSCSTRLTAWNHAVRADYSNVGSSTDVYGLITVGGLTTSQDLDALAGTSPSSCYSSFVPFIIFYYNFGTTTGSYWINTIYFDT